MLGFLLLVVLVLVVAGVILWGIEQFPLDATLKVVIKVVTVVGVVCWIAYTAYQKFGH